MAFEWDDFSDEPSSYRDKALVVENRKFWISPGAVAEFSPVFASMFFSDFNEKGKLEIELPEKKPEDILEMRCLIPIGPIVKPISHQNVLILMSLADEYQIVYLKRRCIDSLVKICREGDERLGIVFAEGVKHSLKRVVRRVLPMFARLDESVTQPVLETLSGQVQNAFSFQINTQKRMIRYMYGASRYTFGTSHKPTILDQDKLTMKYCRCIDQLAVAELEAIGL